VVDHVGAVLVHALCGGLALVDRAETGEVRRLGEVLGLDLDVGVDGLGASGEARLELLDEVDLDATDEADLAALGLERRGRTDEERTLVLGERDVFDVVALGVGGVDERELDLRVGLGDLGHRRGVGEAHGDDVGVAGVDELLEALLAGGFGLTSGGRGLLARHTELLGGLVKAGSGGVVERLVTTPAHVVGHADLDLGRAGRTGARSGGGRAAAAARSERKRSSRHDDGHLHHLTQGGLLRCLSGVRTRGYPHPRRSRL